MTKHEIARILDEIALLLALRGESAFKSRAYANAARTVEALTEDLAALVTSGRIRDLPGIGPAIAERLAELVGTGRSAYHEELARGLPRGLLELASLPGLSLKKARVLCERLGVCSLGELEYACVENRLLRLPGFGEKTQEKIRQAILRYKRTHGFYLAAQIHPEAARLGRLLREAPGIEGVELVGELRRGLEVVQHVSFLAVAASVESVHEALRWSEAVDELQVGDGMVTGRAVRGIPLSVAVVPRITPHLLLAATGSPAHVEALAARARRMGVPWQLEGESPRPTGDTEAQLYAALGLPYLAPELREGLGEIEEAEAGRLGALVEPGDIRGVFHVHTTYSDGAAELADMVAAAEGLGYQYVGISDHSQSAFYANGLKEERIREQQAAIRALQPRFPRIRILSGIESDILPDGRLDYPDEVLARFDFVIASVHSRFNLPEEEQTARIVRALAHPHVAMLGHPTGRLLLSREEYRVDLTRVVEAAATHRKVIEINGSPYRLDLDWRVCRQARARGVRFSINPDAHSIEELHNVGFGVQAARKAGLSPGEIVNTLGPDEALRALRQPV